MNDRKNLHLVSAAPGRTVPASRFGEVVEKKNEERRMRIAAEELARQAVQGQVRLLMVLDRIVRSLPQSTRERLSGVRIGDAAEMNDVALGELLVRIDDIMGGAG